jgi:shikimate dehydrogenase
MDRVDKSRQYLNQFQAAMSDLSRISNDRRATEARAAATGIRGSTRLLGVFGYPVEHSLSPPMHNAALMRLGLSFVYVPFSVTPLSLETALRSLPALGIVGVNLTIPHKERALSLVDEVTEDARQVGAINTVHCVDGRLIADNTDGRGFYQPLREAGLEVRGRQTVVVGAGGAARSVVFRLAREGAETIWLANRSVERAERLAASVAAAGYGAGRVRPLPLDDHDALERAMRGAELLVQTTRVGMAPAIEEMPPIPLQALHGNLFVYDLVYNPMETQLLTEARRRGCQVLGGVKMLVYQGAAAFERWTGVWPPTDVMEAAIMENLRTI